MWRKGLAKTERRSWGNVFLGHYAALFIPIPVLLSAQLLSEPVHVFSYKGTVSSKDGLRARYVTQESRATINSSHVTVLARLSFVFSGRLNTSPA